MNRLLKFILFLALAAAVILILNYRINNYDLRFYFGKDDGYLARVESICVLGAIFFVVMSRRHKFLQMLTGLAAGFLSSIICYLLPVVPFNSVYAGLIFQVSSCVLFILFFFLIERLTIHHKS